MELTFCSVVIFKIIFR